MKSLSLLSPYGVLLCAVLMCSCGTPAAETPHADIRGRVTGRIDSPERMRGQKMIGFLKVEGSAETAPYDKAALTITDTTIITVAVNGSIRKGTFADVHEGDSVEATFIGPVLQSYPPQATAGTLVVHPKQ